MSVKGVVAAGVLRLELPLLQESCCRAIRRRHKRYARDEIAITLTTGAALIAGCRIGLSVRCIL